MNVKLTSQLLRNLVIIARKQKVIVGENTVEDLITEINLGIITSTVTFKTNVTISFPTKQLLKLPNYDKKRRM